MVGNLGFSWQIQDFWIVDPFEISFFDDVSLAIHYVYDTLGFFSSMSNLSIAIKQSINRNMVRRLTNHLPKSVNYYYFSILGNVTTSQAGETHEGKQEYCYLYY